MLVTPPVPFWTASAMPFRLLRFTPSKPVVPFMVPVFVTVTVLAAALPIEVPLDRRLPIPRSEGSIVPLLLSVTLFPVRLIAVPSKPSSTPALAPGFTLTVRLFAALEKLGASRFAAPAQVYGGTTGRTGSPGCGTVHEIEERHGERQCQRFWHPRRVKHCLHTH